MRYDKHILVSQLWTPNRIGFCRCALMLVLFGLAACAQAPDLMAFGGATSATVDLTGDWERAALSQEEKQAWVASEDVPLELETKTGATR